MTKNVLPIPDAVAAIAQKLPTRLELLQQGVSVELIAVLEQRGEVAPAEEREQ